MNTHKRLKPIYIKAQQDYILAEAGFTDIEAKIFKLKMQDKSNVEISFEVNKCERSVAECLKNVKLKISQLQMPKLCNNSTRTMQVI